MTYAIYRTTGIGISAKEEVMSGFSSLDEAVTAFVAWKNEAIADLSKDDENEAYDAIVVRGSVVDLYAIEAA